MGMEDKELGTKDVAAFFGVSQQRVRHMIAFGHLIANKRGRDFYITAASIETYKQERIKRGLVNGRSYQKEGDGATMGAKE
jgi:hypothetical protein